MSFEIKQATRTGIVPLIDLYSESGCGKTMSSLLLARGLAGPNGKIVLIDTESRRGSLYADVIPGGFLALDLDAPFSPQRHVEALQAAFEAKPACVVWDSSSHEWEGLGGVLDMAGENESRSGKPGLHNWKTPKMEHAKLVQFLLRAPVPVVCCIRAKYKTRQGRDDRGKTCIIKDDYTSPIQADDFIFDATCHAEILHDHSVKLTKCSHPSLRDCFPTQGPITVEHGEAIARWCSQAGKPMVSATTSQVKGATFKKQLWDLTKQVHSGDKARLLQWLVNEELVQPDMTLEDLTEPDFEKLIPRAKGKL